MMEDIQYQMDHRSYQAAHLDTEENLDMSIHESQGFKTTHLGLKAIENLKKSAI